jgi:hypothetical protein
MCIVVDINALALVFNPDSSDRGFAPIRAWIERGDGFLVYGGTRYKDELKGTERYLRLVRQLKTAGRAVAISDHEVDSHERIIQRMAGAAAKGDFHIVALLGISHCGLLCSKDKRSFSLVKDRTLYPKGAPRVRIYTSGKNIGLLRRTNKNALRNLE